MAENGSRFTQTSPTHQIPFINPSPSPPPRPPAPSFPRVHRPRLSITSPPPPTTITLQPLGSSLSTATATLLPTIRRPIMTTNLQAAFATPQVEVTLTAPRPDNDRIVNEYVETPFRAELHLAAKNKHNGTDFTRGLEGRLSASSTSSVDRTRNLATRDPHHQTIHLPIVQHQHHHQQQHHNNNKGSVTLKRRPGGVVTKQPGATATFKKDVPSSSASADRSGPGGRGDVNSGMGASGADCFRGSIICPECGRCRCESCRQPRPLPSRWLCNDTCFCSAETAVDYASCLCCVKGVFYHCSKDYELDRDGDGSCADNPCSCGYHRIYTRWGCLSVLALALPCLLCYWPLKGCVSLTEKCYARYANQGCRCEPRDPKITDLTPEKRLLDSHLDF